MKVAHLEGDLLDYWVARADGMDHATASFVIPAHAYSTEWAYGGPIIGRERMSFAAVGTGPIGPNGKAPVVAIPAGSGRAMSGEDHLVAGMRAFVAMVYGDEVPEVKLQ